MYSAELEKHKKEKEEWRRKAERLEDQAASLQVIPQTIPVQTPSLSPEILLWSAESAA